MSHPTFLWHDYETFGIDTRRDRPSQFAAIRTDHELNEIGSPINIFCKPAPDYLPAPQAVLITGITPQHCLEHGLPEHEFAQRIAAAFSEPRTIGVGYNTIRFDDEVTRFLLWRNLIEPYGREWQNQCGRWDLLDVVRLAHALRPNGVEWPKHEDGRPSFKLEHLTAANGLAHEAAHDALSDVRATIALARRLREAQPRLFDFALSLRSKEQAATEISLARPRPFLHVSGMFPAERGCLAVMWPLAPHPVNKNEIIAWDLAHDPLSLTQLSANDIRERLFTAAADLPEGLSRLPIKTIRLNRSPMVVGNLKTLSPEQIARWQIDMALTLKHAENALTLPDLTAIWTQVFVRSPSPDVEIDAETDLYGGFIGATDRKMLDQLRQLPPDELARAKPAFSDGRLDDLLLRYRARNFPETLSAPEREEWQHYRIERLLEGRNGARTLDDLLAELDVCSQTATDEQATLLESLHEYAETITENLGNE